MSPYPQADTDWHLSAKGNHWKPSSGVVLVVGQSPHGGFWAMRDGNFVAGQFDSLLAAKCAAEWGTPDE